MPGLALFALAVPVRDVDGDARCNMCMTHAVFGYMLRGEREGV
jgi:hypothetical protein